MLDVAAIHLPGGGRNDAFMRSYPIPLDENSLATRVAREGIVVNIADVDTEPSLPEPQRRRVRTLGARSLLIVPMLRDGQALGMIIAGRREPGAFTEKQVTLLQTFAHQAVIAIENVRLFTELGARNRELTEALEQQTATAEILRVISSSPTDLQPVMDTVAENAARVCGATDSLIFRLDGTVLRLVARHRALPSALEIGETISATRDTVTGRAVTERRTIHVEDLWALPETEFSETRERARRKLVGPESGRTLLATPLLRAGMPVGAIMIRRAEVRPFSARQIGLLQTFAHQAVIAIENVRLFTELQQKNRALTDAHAQVTEALEQQTATAEILGVISRSQTDVQPVFDAIVESAVRLCDARHGAVFSFDGDLVHLVAHHNFSPVWLEQVRTEYPTQATRARIAGRVILSGSVIQIPDSELDPEYAAGPAVMRVGIRSLLAVPMLRKRHRDRSDRHLPAGARAVPR